LPLESETKPASRAVLGRLSRDNWPHFHLHHDDLELTVVVPSKSGINPTGEI
jgi:hypothetical protein